MGDAASSSAKSGPIAGGTEKTDAGAEEIQRSVPSEAKESGGKYIIEDTRAMEEVACRGSSGAQAIRLKEDAQAGRVAFARTNEYT